LNLIILIERFLVEGSIVRKPKKL